MNIFQSKFVVIIFLVFSRFHSKILEFPIKIQRLDKNKEKHPLRSRYLSSSLSENPIILEMWNNLFLLEISIGTPAQKFNILLDTGSLNLVIGDINSNVPFANKFNKSQSSTFTSNGIPFSQAYVSGTMSGIYGEDQVGIGDIKSVNLTFGLIQKSAFATDYGDLKFDGIMGFGNTYNLNGIGPDQSIIQQMAKNKVIGNEVFSIHYLSSFSTNPESTLYVGDYHDNFTSAQPFHTGFCNCVQDILKVHYWSCSLKYILFGDIANNEFQSKKIPLKGNLIFDSGSNACIMPISAFSTFFEEYKQQKCIELVDYTEKYILCPSLSSLKDISFVVNGYALKIKKEVIFLPVKDIELGYSGYLLQIIFSSTFSDFLLGTQFFSDYHTLFDREKQQIHFYSYEGLIGNFTNYTKDGEWDWSEHYHLIALFVILILLLILIFAIIYNLTCKSKSKGKNKSENEGPKLLIPAENTL